MSKVLFCICTYNRNKDLDNLIKSIDRLDNKYDLSIKIAIVDNSPNKLAYSLINELNKERKKYIIYRHCEEKGISNARNTCLDIVREEECDFVGMFDDDEKVDKKWLDSMYELYRDTRVPIIMGPCITEYTKETPQIIIKSKVYERQRMETGTILKDGRAGNVFLSSKIIKDNNINFDMSFNFTGGEDTDFFIRLNSIGYEIIWCNEACIYEVLPKSRANLKYIMQRAYSNGCTYMNIKLKDNQKMIILDLIRSLLKIVITFIIALGCGISYVYRYKSIVYLRKMFCAIGEVSFITRKKTLSMYG